MSLADELINHKVLLISGKGGIGKSLISSVLGYRAASRGKRVCIVSSSDDDQIAPQFCKSGPKHQIISLAPNLFSINLDHNLNFRDFIVKHMGFEKLFDRVFSTAMVKSFVRMLPGVAELTLLGRIFYMSELSPEKFDLVIFDGFASGHFLNLLTTPRAVMNSGLIGPVSDETKRVVDFFNATEKNNSAIVLLTTLEPLVLSELEDFIPKIQQSNFSILKSVLANRYIDGDRHVTVPICNYFAHHYKSQGKLQLDQLRRIVERCGLCDKQLGLIPDLGAVSEPLSSDDVDFLCQMIV